MSRCAPDRVSTRERDRRRSPRFSCGGEAKIVCLPSDGISFAGRVRDLSLGGCWIETVSPISCGVRAEILLRTNTSAFRAVGQVKAVRERRGICLQFERLSAGGQKMLTQLVAELARLQAMTSALRCARQEKDTEFSSASPQRRGFQAVVLQKTYPVFGSTPMPQCSGATPRILTRQVSILEPCLAASTLDFFV
jgi:PilZ domain-containing protein